MLVMFVAFLVLGASSQSAVCEVECEMEIPQLSCHSAGYAGEHASTAGAPAADMSPAHLHQLPKGSSGQAFVQGIERCDGDCCKQASGWAADETRPASNDLEVGQRAVEVLSIDLAIPDPNTTATETPPLRPLSAHPLSVVLRV